MERGRDGWRSDCDKICFFGGALGVRSLRAGCAKNNVFTSTSTHPLGHLYLLYLTLSVLSYNSSYLNHLSYAETEP